MKKLFKIANIDVYATDEQIEEYTFDNRQYDYIRAKVGKLLADIYRVKGNTDYISCARLFNNIKMLIISSKELKYNPNIAFYKDKKIMFKTKIEDLLVFKNDNITETIKNTLLANTDSKIIILDKEETESIIQMINEKQQKLYEKGDVFYEDINLE